MKIIPNSGSNSAAENTVRNLIQKIPDRDGECALWSVHVPEHEYKEFSELDFIIISQKGIICIEVKGGGVSYVDGRFTFKNRFGKINTKSEGPMDQVSSNKKELQKKINSVLSLESIPLFAHCIVLPECEWKPEVDPYSQEKELICDIATANDQKKFEAFINNLFKYFKEKPGYKKSSNLTNSDLKKIKDFLRPDFDLIKPLKYKLQEVKENMFKATSEQMQGLINLEDNKKVLCKGPAGSGKTLLACKHAINLSQNNEEVAFVCRNESFYDYIKPEFEDSQVKVICLEKNYSPLFESKFDSLVIDEGQDLLNIDCLGKVESLLKEDFESDSSKIYFFMDNHLQSHMYDDYDENVLDFFGNKFMKYTLTKNCRNPIEIIKETNAIAGTEIISMVKAKSDETKFYPVQNNNKKNHAQALDRVITSFLEKEISLQDITIISLEGETNSCVNELINPAYIGNFNEKDSGKINFFDVKSIKGQETEVVIVVDCYDDIKDKKFKNLFYTSLTRATLSAVVISTQNIEKYLKSLINN